MKNKKKENNLSTSQNKNTPKNSSPTNVAAIRQNSKYNSSDSAAPDNNLFWEERSNPLSSKGN